jgi:hypothetical protein
MIDFLKKYIPNRNINYYYNKILQYYNNYDALSESKKTKLNNLIIKKIYSETKYLNTKILLNKSTIQNYNYLKLIIFFINNIAIQHKDKPNIQHINFDMYGLKHYNVIQKIFFDYYILANNIDPNINLLKTIKLYSKNTSEFNIVEFSNFIKRNNNNNLIYDIKKKYKIKTYNFLFKKNKEGDFKWEIENNYRNRINNSLYIFEDNLNQSNTSEEGNYSDNIRKYNYVKMHNKPISAGICTGESDKTSFNSTWKNYIDKDLDKIRYLLSEYNYKNLIYQSEFRNDIKLFSSHHKSINQKILEYITENLDNMKTLLYQDNVNNIINNNYKKKLKSINSKFFSTHKTTTAQITYLPELITRKKQNKTSKNTETGKDTLLSKDSKKKEVTPVVTSTRDSKKDKATYSDSVTRSKDSKKKDVTSSVTSLRDSKNDKATYSVTSLRDFRKGSKTGSLKVSETGSKTGSLKVPETGSKTGSLKVSETGSLRGSKTSSLKVSETGSLRGSKTSSLKVSETGSLRGSETSSLKVPETSSLRGSKTSSLRGSKTGSLRSSKQDSLKGSETGSLKGSKQDSLKHTQNKFVDMIIKFNYDLEKTISYSINSYAKLIMKKKDIFIKTIADLYIIDDILILKKNEVISDNLELINIYLYNHNKYSSFVTILPLKLQQQDSDKTILKKDVYTINKNIKQIRISLILSKKSIHFPTIYNLWNFEKNNTYLMFYEAFDNTLFNFIKLSNQSLSPIYESIYISMIQQMLMAIMSYHNITGLINTNINPKNIFFKFNKISDNIYIKYKVYDDFYYVPYYGLIWYLTDFSESIEMPSDDDILFNKTFSYDSYHMYCEFKVILDAVKTSKIYSSKYRELYDYVNILNSYCDLLRDSDNRRIYSTENKIAEIDKVLFNLINENLINQSKFDKITKTKYLYNTTAYDITTKLDKNYKKFILSHYDNISYIKNKAITFNV